ncbi:hypothetical protein [Cochleicola gelatinilyticus]|uniref:Uncharacterized protein n=1 Tax=Cochleicola gelatinilyticus TaxID=1763537 RepID=A0A167HUC9_9FLAO|nr:hypothetical protein [Cochleicola gelatinilyticus]OAB78971.1 hypothetical protein ULVI_10380 [Cochleicola gelatinilyticus]
MKLVIQLVLWVVIVFLGYQLYNSVIGPVNFNKVKEARYAKVIKNLKDIKNAELAHQEITGKFTGDFDSLIRFLDTAKYAITVRRDTSYADQAKNKAYGLDALTGGYIIEEIVTDTLGFTSVKDSLYKGSDRFKTMMNVPIEGVNEKFELKAGSIVKNKSKYPVFEARVAKDLILGDKNKDLLAQEKQVVSVDGVNGAYISVGSMTDVNTTGNWPKKYDTAQDK